MDGSSMLLTGGSGLLGKELQKYLIFIAPSSKKLPIDISFMTSYYRKSAPHVFDLVVHSAAYTDLGLAEGKGKQDCFNVNFFGTKNMVDNFKDVPFVYISTEYVYNPVNFYSLTKLEAEKYVRSYHPKHLIIRTLFKPRPFPHTMAFKDQLTRGDYVDVIAPLIVSAITGWDKKKSYTLDIGTERKTMYELAQRTRPDVIAGSVKDALPLRLPKDYRPYLDYK